MNFQQLRIIRETVRRDFNLTEVAGALATAQSGVSKHIRDLELELGVDLFVRRGKRLTAMTEPGNAILPLVERILIDSGSIKSIASELGGREGGELRIATTHTQARYVLPPIVAAFRAAHPGVRLVLFQTSPVEITRMLLDGSADIGIATEELSRTEDLLTFPFYRWRHLAIAPIGHPLAGGGPCALPDIAKYPIITYHHGFTGRALIDHEFAKADVKPDIVMEAIDADVIKEYVRLGMGVGIVASMAADPNDPTLTVVTPRPSFAESTTHIALRRERFLPAYAYRFIERCRPELSEVAVKTAARAAIDRIATPGATVAERPAVVPLGTGSMQ